MSNCTILDLVPTSPEPKKPRRRDPTLPCLARPPNEGVTKPRTQPFESMDRRSNLEARSAVLKGRKHIAVAASADSPSNSLQTLLRGPSSYIKQAELWDFLETIET